MFERLAQKNSQVRITVQVLSAADGVTRLSGHAAAIQTLINASSPNGLLRRGGAQAAESVTVTEQGTTGFYDITFTPLTGAATGEPYLLFYREPTGVGSTDRIEQYAIQVFDSISVTPVGGSYFTTLANLREFIGAGSTNEDALLANLIARATVEMQTWMDRAIFQATYTEKHDGRGWDRITVIEAPIISVTSVHDDLDAAFGASTLIAASDYLFDDTSGVRNEGFIALKNGRRFLCGFRNVKVVYVGGYSTVPLDLEQVCLERAASAFERRSSLTTGSISSGDTTRTLLPSARFTKDQKDAMAPYRRAA